MNNPMLERLCPNYCRLKQSLQRFETDLVTLLNGNTNVNNTEAMLRTELQAMMVQVPMVGRDVFNVVHGIKDAERERSINNSVNSVKAMVAQIKSSNSQTTPNSASAKASTQATATADTSKTGVEKTETDTAKGVKAKAKPRAKAKTKTKTDAQKEPTPTPEPIPEPESEQKPNDDLLAG